MNTFPETLTGPMIRRVDESNTQTVPQTVQQSANHGTEANPAPTAPAKPRRPKMSIKLFPDDYPLSPVSAGHHAYDGAQRAQALMDEFRQGRAAGLTSGAGTVNTRELSSILRTGTLPPDSVDQIRKELQALGWQNQQGVGEPFDPDLANAFDVASRAREEPGMPFASKVQLLGEQRGPFPPEAIRRIARVAADVSDFSRGTAPIKRSEHGQHVIQQQTNHACGFTCCAMLFADANGGRLAKGLDRQTLASRGLFPDALLEHIRASGFHAERKKIDSSTDLVAIAKDGPTIFENRGHYMILDAINEEDRTARIRDPLEGWQIDVDLDHFESRLRSDSLSVIFPMKKKE